MTPGYLSLRLAQFMVAVGPPETASSHHIVRQAVRTAAR